MPDTIDEFESEVGAQEEFNFDDLPEDVRERETMTPMGRVGLQNRWNHQRRKSTVDLAGWVDRRAADRFWAKRKKESKKTDHELFVEEAMTDYHNEIGRLSRLAADRNAIVTPIYRGRYAQSKVERSDSAAGTPFFRWVDPEPGRLTKRRPHLGHEIHETDDRFPTTPPKKRRLLPDGSPTWAV